MVLFLLNCDFSVNVTGESLSILNLIGRLLTKTVIVKNSGSLLFIHRAECIFCITEWIVFGVHSSPALRHRRCLFLIPLRGLLFCLRSSI